MRGHPKIPRALGRPQDPTGAAKTTTTRPYAFWRLLRKETEYIDTHAPPTGRFLRHNGAALERRRFEENNNKIPLKAVRSDNHAALCGRLEHQKECTLWVLRNEKTRLTLAQRRRLESTHGPLRSGRCGGFVSPEDS